MKTFKDRSDNWYVRPRPAKRVGLRIPFHVSGRDENGFLFEEQAQTIDVGQGGGCLVLDKDVRTGDYLRLRSPRGSSFLVHIRWFKYDMTRDLRFVGFQVVEPAQGWVVSGGTSRQETA